MPLVLRLLATFVVVGVVGIVGVICSSDDSRRALVFGGTALAGATGTLITFLVMIWTAP